MRNRSFFTSFPFLSFPLSFLFVLLLVFAFHNKVLGFRRREINCIIHRIFDDVIIDIAFNWFPSLAVGFVTDL